MKKLLGKVLTAVLVVCMVMSEISSSTAYASYLNEPENIFSDTEDVHDDEGQENVTNDDEFKAFSGDEVYEESAESDEIISDIPKLLDETYDEGITEDGSDSELNNSGTDAPILSSDVEVSSEGIRISWAAVTDEPDNNVTCYGIFRKADTEESWTLIATTEPEVFTYTDSGAEAGITYYYTVRAYYGVPDDAWDDTNFDSEDGSEESNWSACDPDGVMGRFIDAPILGAATAEASGTKITWTAVNGASGYEILRKSSGGSWEVIGRTSSLNYTDKDITGRTSGNTYYYTVRAFIDGPDEAGDHYDDLLYWSEYNTSGIQTVYLAVPKLNSVSVNTKGEEISWGSVSGASGYAVYRRVSGGSWSMIDTTTSTSYVDSSTGKIAGKTYEYTVRAYTGSVTTAKDNRYSASYWSGYDSSGAGSVYLAVPALNSATAEAKGVKISWGKVSGATGYAVYRKVSGGSWAMIGTTTSTSYTDTDTSGRTSGKTYLYTVRAYVGEVTTAKNNRYNSLYWSGYNSTGVSSVYLATPKLSSTVTAEAKGRKVSWNSVSGASGYAVYRKKSGGSWSMIATTTSTSYTDTASLSSGSYYYYTVRAYKGSVTTAKNNRYSASYWSGYDSSGAGSVYLAVPELNSATAEAKGVKVSWNKVSGATGYAVYRKVSGGSWSMIGTTTSTSYTDTDTSGRTSGKTYLYTVRAYVGNVTTAKNNRYNSLYWSGYNSSGVSTIYLATPKLSSKASADAKGRTVSWNSVSGASGYAVYRKKSGGSWTMIATTTSTSYTDTEALSSGNYYYYTVRAYKGNVTTAKNNRYSASYWSGYDSSGVECIYLKTPSLSSVSVSTSGNTVKWGSVSGASGYAVYRKKSGGSWTMIGTTTSTSYKDSESLDSNTAYYYTVRAYYGSESTAKSNRYNALYWSGYDSSGLVTVENASMNNKAQVYSSSTKYLILVDRTLNRVGIYTGSKGNWTRKYYWECTTGKSSTPTPTGSYTVGSRGKSFSGSNYTCWYYTQFYGNYLFHSVLYKKNSMTTIYDGELGVNKSHGCVRLSMTNAKWIYDNIPQGTKVIIY